VNSSVNLGIGLLLLPALTFALVYPFALDRLARLNSSYPKVDVSTRIMAGGIDAALGGGALYFWANTRSLGFVAVGALYLGLRDGLGGRRVGKFVFGLVVISLETGRPCSLAHSVRRNVLFLFPGVNLAAAVLESVTMARDSFGYRLGDRLARTQVVKGFGAKDVVTSALDWIAPPERMSRAPTRPAVRDEAREVA